MGWTETARREHVRGGLRYASDCTGEEWAIIAPLLTRKTRVGRPRLQRGRDIWNAIQYLAAMGCRWPECGSQSAPTAGIIDSPWVKTIRSLVPRRFIRRMNRRLAKLEL